jgi:hypothetical protein
MNDALSNIECTSPRVENEDFTTDFKNGQPCLFPCPSHIYTNSEYASQHIAFVVPALLAVVPTSALIFQMLFRQKTHGLTTPIQFIAVFSALYIIVGPLLSAILYFDLPCGCSTALCTGNNALCSLSRLSSFFLQAIQYFTVASIAPLYMKIVRNSKMDDNSLHRKLAIVSTGIPLICIILGYVLESTDPEDENYHWNQISSAFSCQLRLPDMATEVRHLN